MTSIRRPPPALSALAVLLIANALALGAAARNHSAEPAALIELTERELPIAGGARDDTSIFLRLDWTPANAAWPVESAGPLLDRAGLAALGFDVELPRERDAAAHHADRQLPRRAFLVLEQEGEAWTAWLAGYREWAAREDEPRHGDCCDPEDTERSHSRLFVVDVGLDAVVLRRAYPDRQRFAIAPGVVRLTVHHPEGAAPVPDVQVQELLVGRVNVPRALRPLLAELRANGAAGRPRPPRFTAKVAWGRSHQPWLVSVAAIAAAQREDPAPDGGAGRSSPVSAAEPSR